MRATRWRWAKPPTKLAESGARVRGVAFDVTSADSVTEAIDYIESEIGPIDILVNNAGMQHRAPLEDFPADKFEQVMATNVTSVFIVGQAVAQAMIPRGAGKIINICSLMSSVGRADRSRPMRRARPPSPTSRAAWRPTGRSTASTSTASRRATSRPSSTRRWSPNAEFNAWVEKRTPMGRWGEVAELGGAAIFLASDAASFVNGHILYVDGAFTATV